MNYLSTGAGFCPSTVHEDFYHTCFVWLFLWKSAKFMHLEAPVFEFARVQHVPLLLDTAMFNTETFFYSCTAYAQKWIEIASYLPARCDFALI